MITLLLITAGGATGAALRYLTGLGTVKIFGSSHIITGTIIVNILGCFLAGLSYYWLIESNHAYNEFQQFFLTGILSSYTTFSTFALEAWHLLKRSGKRLLLYLFLQIIAGVAAAAAGFQWMQWITPL